MDNFTIVQRLMGMAHELEGRQSNLYRVRAYRRAAATVQGLDQSVAEIVAESGEFGLRQLPGIGSSLADTIADLVRADEFTNLNPESELAAVG